MSDAMKRLQERFGKSGGKGPGGATLLFWLLPLALLIWVFSSAWYIVDEGEVAVVKRFGAPDRQEGPGFHLKLPVPFETTDTVPFTALNTESIGVDRSGRLIRDEALMITQDQNIADIQFSVQWRVNDAIKFLYNVRGQASAVSSVAESAMREVIGRRTLDGIITTERVDIEREVQELIQATLDKYDAGITVRTVQLSRSLPPQEVEEAFRDVVSAAQDAERKINEAQRFQNDIVPRARGEAARILQDAEAYKARVTAEATGEAERFRLILEEYEQAPATTRQRMYLETLEEVYGKSTITILDEGEGGTGVVPFLPLNELNRNRGGQ